MESDSESEQLRARFEALKIPTGASDGLAKPQLSPTAPSIDRAALDADLRQRLHALGMSGSESGTEIDEEELERFLASEDEWYDEFNDPATRTELTNEVRTIMSKLNGGSDFSGRNPTRQDSVRTITSVPNQYSGDSDADDEAATDAIGRLTREDLSLSQSSSSQSSRNTSLVRPAAKFDAGNSTDDDDDDKSITGDNATQAGLRTPPSHPKRLSTDTVGRYEKLFSSLETPRALPVMTPTDENGPLPPAFAKLQGISPHTGKIGDKDYGFTTTNPGPAPKLDIEGWRASKDDKPDTWCCICNADASLKCSGCDNDLYCKSCFDAGHPSKAFDASEHKTTEYHAPT